MSHCTECGKPTSFNMSLCDECGAQSQTRSHQRAAAETAARDLAAAQIGTDADMILVTTASMLEGYRVVETIDIVTAECVFSMSFLQDWIANEDDSFGGRSETMQQVLRDARRRCLQELRTEAFLVGANAVIAVDLDYSEFSGQGKAMLFLVASGTAVHVEPRVIE
jgi:uncharacterized protein YbjQ (UPF0145 family)